MNHSKKSFLIRVVVLVGMLMNPFSSSIVCTVVRADPRLTTSWTAADPKDNEFNNAAWQKAKEAAKAGDDDALQQWLAAQTETRKSGRAAEVELAEQLAMLSVDLSQDGDVASSSRIGAIAHLALEKFQKKGGSPDAIWAGLWQAKLHELVEHDPISARADFQRVLRLDSTNQVAAEGLARLNLADAVLAQKVKEQVEAQTRGEGRH